MTKPLAEFKTLSMADQAKYVDVREYIRGVMTREDGFAFVINATVATGHEFITIEMANWLDGVQGVDLRDLNSFCHDSERLVVVPNPVIDLG